MNDPSRPWKKAVFSRYIKGDSVKTVRYRYTEWTNDMGKLYARMLYDHREDPAENVNISEKVTSKAVVSEMRAMLEKGWKCGLPQ